MSAGSALMVVLSISHFGVADASGYLWFSLVGAALASAAVYLLGSVGKGRGSPATLILAGAVVTFLLTAVTTTILVLDDATLERFQFWDVGSLAGRDTGVLATVLPVMVIGAVIAIAAGRALNTLSLGSDLATALGQRVLVVRVTVAAGIVLLAGAAVAAAGPIVFVGLAVPHVARALVGPDYRWIAAYSLVLDPGAVTVSSRDALRDRLHDGIVDHLAVLIPMLRQGTGLGARMQWLQTADVISSVLQLVGERVGDEAAGIAEAGRLTGRAGSPLPLTGRPLHDLAPRGPRADALPPGLVLPLVAQRRGRLLHDLPAAPR